MDRLTGTFKRRYSQPFTFLVAAVTTILLNADSIAIAKYLYSNPDARAKVAAQAYKAASDSTLIKRLYQINASGKDSVSLAQIKSDIGNGLININEANAALNGSIPLGWKQKTNEVTFLIVISKITGLLATILAIFMGAPFWFDILNKIANLRGTGPKPPSSTGSDANDSKDK